MYLASDSILKFTCENTRESVYSYAGVKDRYSFDKKYRVSIWNCVRICSSKWKSTIIHHPLSDEGLLIRFCFVQLSSVLSCTFFLFHPPISFTFFLVPFEHFLSPITISMALLFLVYQQSLLYFFTSYYLFLLWQSYNVPHLFEYNAFKL